MSAIHHIDNDSMLIITVWDGEATDTMFEEALRKYHKDIRSKPDCIHYNEIVDLRKATPMKLTINGLLSIGRIAIDAEKEATNKKMALIVNSDIAFTFANLYVFYRNLGRSDRKKISVFLNDKKAYEWVKSST